MLKIACSSMLLVISAVIGGGSEAAEFQAAIGHEGYGRCHMDYCSFFIIDRATMVADGRDGTLFKIEQRDWGAEYAPPKDNDPDPRDEYDRPPSKVDEKQQNTKFVYCSKTRPTVFDFVEGKWQATHLRPGADMPISGAYESSY